MLEQPFFFERGDARLFGVLHQPGTTASRTAFLLSHAFGEEKLWSHRVLVSVARALCQRGHVVMRFDYMGAGDSSGSTPDTSLQTHLEDLNAALQTLSDRNPHVDRVGLLGLRLGASIAALFAEQGASQAASRLLDGAPLILWDPILDGANYFQELLRSNLSTQLAVYGAIRENREVLQERIRAGDTVNVDGYDIGKALFESCGRPDLLTLERKRHAGPTLVAQISAGTTQKDRDDLRSLAQSYPAGTFQRATEQPFWREIRQFYGRAANLQDATLQWLEQTHVAD